MKTTIYLSVIIFLITSCGSTQDEIAATQDNKDTIEVINNEPPRIEHAMWLLGEWENIFEGGRAYEGWVLENDSLLTGLNYTIDNGDTIQYETIELRQRGIDLFYIPTVSDQNEGEIVEFKLTNFTDSTLIFENPLHDFPQKISYINYGGDSLMAEISGIYEGEPGLIQFPLRRIK